MITQFKLVGSKKLLKELYLKGCIPAAKSHVKIDDRLYFVALVTFDVDNDMYIVWLRKFK